MSRLSTQLGDDALGALAYAIDFPDDMRLYNVSILEFRFIRKAAEELPNTLVYEA